MSISPYKRIRGRGQQADSENAPCEGGATRGVTARTPCVGRDKASVSETRLMRAEEDRGFKQGSPHKGIFGWSLGGVSEKKGYLGGAQRKPRSHALIGGGQALSSGNQVIHGHMWAGKVRDEKTSPVWVGPDIGFQSVCPT